MCKNCDDLGLVIKDGKLEQCDCQAEIEWARQFSGLQDGEALEMLHGKFVETPSKAGSFFEPTGPMATMKQ